MLDQNRIDSLFPADLAEPEEWEARYPQRTLAPGALVTRFSPSPTGYLHIGGIYAAMLDKDLAQHSGGTYLVRVEDTDQSREVAGARDQFARAFALFGVEPIEDEATGQYGPYLQSERRAIYESYVRQLLREGKAYPCFATRDELAAMTADQQNRKVPTGYYGRWAPWRDAPDADVEQALAAGQPFVVRFRSPGLPEQRVEFADAIRGRIVMDDNQNDTVILKSSDQPLRLPTYHFAHAVDDHLMRVNLVLRGEEWIPSVALHLQLFAALGFEPIEYAHIAPLLKLEGRGKRKLSKRKDPEASVDFYANAGYPPEAVLYYLRGLANGRLAELSLAEALNAPIRLSEMSASGPLVDLVKLDDICGDHVSTLSGAQIYEAVREWARDRDPELAEVLAHNRPIALAALAIERDGVSNPRKDLRKWSDFRSIYGYFFNELFTPLENLRDTPLASLPTDVVSAFARDVAADYVEKQDPQEWFDQIRALAARHGFAASPKEHNANPDRYPGSIRDAAQIIRVALTGSTRSPDLQAVAFALGADEVKRRVGALA
jgi:glutamyl-tRNA synthetase